MSSNCEWLVFKLNSLSVSVSHTLVQEICTQKTTRPCYYWKVTTDIPLQVAVCQQSYPKLVCKNKTLLIMPWPTGILSKTVTFHTQTAAYHCEHVVLRAAVSVSDKLVAPPISTYIPIDRNKCLFGKPYCACTLGPGCVCGWLFLWGNHD